MKIERKIVIQLNNSEDNLFTDFLDFLEELTNKMYDYHMSLDAKTANTLTDLSNAFTLLDRAYEAITEKEVKN